MHAHTAAVPVQTESGTRRNIYQICMTDKAEMEVSFDKCSVSHVLDSCVNNCAESHLLKHGEAKH